MNKMKSLPSLGRYTSFNTWDFYLVPCYWREALVGWLRKFLPEKVGRMSRGSLSRQERRRRGAGEAGVFYVHLSLVFSWALVLGPLQIP
jgi:hypothetical protein